MDLGGFWGVEIVSHAKLARRGGRAIPFLTSRDAIGALVHSEGRLEVSSENDSRQANEVARSKGWTTGRAARFGGVGTIMGEDAVEEHDLRRELRDFVILRVVTGFRR